MVQFHRKLSDDTSNIRINFQNTDVLILTVVCGLKTVSVYSMYVMLFGMVGTAISTINSGVSFAMGQAYNTDKKSLGCCIMYLKHIICP